MISARTYFILLGIGLLLIVLSYLYIDIPVAQWVYSQPEVLRTVSDFLSNFAEAVYYLVAALLGWVVYTYYRPDAFYASRYLFIFTSVLSSGVAVLVLKVIFGKARPPVILRDDMEFGFYWFEFKPFLVSFPSGHTTTAFTLFTALSIFFPRLTWLWLAFALSMALARIGAADHFVSDTIAGALLGIGITLYIAHRYAATFFKERS